MRIRIGICVLAAAAITALLHAQIPVSDRANLDDYVRTVRSAQAGGGSVEAAFAKATAVCSLLLRIDDSEALRESLSAEDVRALQTLPGILVTGDLNSARPDQQFFSALAQAHGTPADRRFFETLNFTSPPGQWAIYLDGASDMGACTRYGTGSLVAAYRRWTDFQRTFPDRYVQRSTKALNDISEELMRPVCACGDLSSVTKELEAFLKAFPSAPANAEVAAAARAVKANPAGVRTSCRPG